MIEKECLLNPSSVRSQTSRDESNCYVLTDEESMYSIIPAKRERVAVNISSSREVKSELPVG